MQRIARRPRALARIAAVLLLTAAKLLLAGSAQAADRVYPSADSVEPLGPGDAVPSARVESVQGESVDVSELVRSNGALLVFYRGGW